MSDERHAHMPGFRIDKAAHTRYERWTVEDTNVPQITQVWVTLDPEKQWENEQRFRSTEDPDSSLVPVDYLKLAGFSRVQLMRRHLVMRYIDNEFPDMVTDESGSHLHLSAEIHPIEYEGVDHLTLIFLRGLNTDIEEYREIRDAWIEFANGTLETIEEPLIPLPPDWNLTEPRNGHDGNV